MIPHRTRCAASRHSGAPAPTKSFLGREDRTLDGRLHAELPGILKWALEGLDRLNLTGMFTVPASSEDAAALMMDLASPGSAFVPDCCIRKPSEAVLVDHLYDAWKLWAEDNGHQAGAKSTFGRNLRAVVPEVKIIQPGPRGSRVKCYAHIGLLPVHPVRDDESAGKDATGGDRHPVHADAPDQPAFVCTRCGAESDDGNSLVNGLCTGCTGRSPLKAQHGDAGDRNDVSTYGRFAPDPPCFHCDKPVVGEHRDEHGR